MIDNSIGSGVKVGQLNEPLVALFYIAKGRARQSLHPKILNRKRGNDRPIDDGAPHAALAAIAGAGQLSEEAAGEGIPGSRRVENLLQRIGWRGKDRGIGKLEYAVFAPLDQNRLGTHFEYGSGRAG